jgi:hypothetical protein
MDAAQQYDVCPECNGLGFLAGDRFHPCHVCSGAPARVQGPTWFRIVVEARGAEAIGYVLVIGGRIASHSFGFCFVGKDFEEYRADAERKTWKLEELPHV